MFGLVGLGKVWLDFWLVLVGFNCIWEGLVVFGMAAFTLFFRFVSIFVV